MIKRIRKKSTVVTTILISNKSAPNSLSFQANKRLPNIGFKPVDGLTNAKFCLSIEKAGLQTARFSTWFSLSITPLEGNMKNGTFKNCLHGFAQDGWTCWRRRRSRHLWQKNIKTITWVEQESTNDQLLLFALDPLTFSDEKITPNCPSGI